MMSSRGSLRSFSAEADGRSDVADRRSPMAEQLLYVHPSRVLEATPSPRLAALLPADFEIFQYPGARRTVILRSQLRDRLIAADVQNPESLKRGPLFSGWIEGGRTRHALIRVEGESWVLKEYRRGGLVGRWNSSRYWRCGRFFEELRVSDLAERSGISTAGALALIIERAGLGSVRAWLLTRFLPGVRPLHAFFGDPFESDLFRAAGGNVASMHRARIDHPDLHLGNIVGSVDSEGVHAHIVDWDRARLRVPGSWNPSSNLLRLWRSVEKGRRLGAFGTSASRKERSLSFSSRPLRAFIRGYFDGNPGALREARKYLRRRARFFGMRT